MTASREREARRTAAGNRIFRRAGVEDSQQVVTVRLPVEFIGRLLNVAVNHLHRLDPEVARLFLEQVKMLARKVESGAVVHPEPTATEKETRDLELMATEAIMAKIETHYSHFTPKFMSRPWLRSAAAVGLIELDLEGFAGAHPKATRAQWRKHLVEQVWGALLEIRSVSFPEYLVDAVMKAKTRASAARQLVAEAYGVDVETLRRTMNRPPLKGLFRI